MPLAVVGARAISSSANTSTRKSRNARTSFDWRWLRRYAAKIVGASSASQSREHRDQQSGRQVATERNVGEPYHAGTGARRLVKPRSVVAQQAALHVNRASLSFLLEDPAV